MCVQSVYLCLLWNSLIKLHSILHTAQGSLHFFCNIHVIYVNTYQDGHVDILCAGFKKWSVHVMEESTVHVGVVASIALQ